MTTNSADNGHDAVGQVGIRAAARKIAVVMLRLWRDGTTFAWTKEALPT